MCHHGIATMPPAALVNDLMIFYAPRELYAKSVTMMEMICASTCLTSMVFFSFEAKHRNVRASDTEVHMSRHRMGARGNATSFPLPWEELLRQMQGDGEGGQDGEAPDLPHVGTTLSDMVSVLLKTSEEDDPKSMASFIHQAHVRRDVVVELIAGARAGAPQLPEGEHGLCGEEG